MNSTTLDLYAPVIDVQDVIDYFETLEESSDERRAIGEMLDTISGRSGDIQRGEMWYPSHLIANWHFEEYVRELIDDSGDFPHRLPDYIAIDWGQTAENIQQDYSRVEVMNRTYWYNS